MGSDTLSPIANVDTTDHFVIFHQACGCVHGEG